MRRNYPKRTCRDPEEHYDKVYDSMPDRPEVSRIINHPRKLITINLAANPYLAEAVEVFREHTCYEDDLEVI